MKTILLIDDNPEINKMISTVLNNEYNFLIAYSGTEGLLLFNQHHVDLILLDRMLPGKSGDEILNEIRNISNIPIIMLTALTSKDDIANLLVSGANDYITKPFNINELRARLIVQLRDEPTDLTSPSSACIQHRDLTLYPDTCEIGNNEQRVQLKKKEFELLSLLFHNPNRIFSKEALYNKIWKASYYGDENTVNVHISSLRRKIKLLCPQSEYIETVWGIGIKLV